MTGSSTKSAKNVQAQRAETIRAFVAVALPPDVQAAIEGLQQELKPRRLNLRWVKPENIHLTVKFLGDIGTGEVDKVKQVVADTACIHRPLQLSAQGIGVFPGPQRPRILWVGLTGDTEALGELAQGLDSSLADLGFAPEDRPFKAHLTIGRFKKEGHPGDVAGALERHRDFAAGHFRVDGLHLFRSQLRPEGPVYTHLAEFSLAC